ncbi:aromatic ring-hydroxylating dioxygenase subunit alpha [Novosphingobium terrae]|uniref:aromatic ring-hydroxylating dioxygenase subunit alpha n=1 Tax=Novosphingobium terrae TaxID=2726189 RepID=UPI00197CEBBD|nr:aromatic ring-hydroxylating dioxygenase subunit alpha [Novosphingobium terrae]
MSFVKNAWYMAGWASELGQAPRAITMLNEPVVLFRGEDGVAGALLDVCPHRAVPLSLGTVTGNHIVCPYHGIELDRGAVCRKNPHIQGAPDRLKGRAYPIEERHGMLWIWPGDAALADPEQIPDYSWFNAPEKFTTGRGYLHIQADYRLVIDNLLDLAHADYIHPGTVGQPGAAEVQQVTVLREGNSVSVNAIWPDLPPSALHKRAWTRTERVDKYLDMKWLPASNLLLDLGIMAPGTPRETGIRTPAAHILTPETENSTHYYWISARDFDLANEELTAHLVGVINRAFLTEDKPIIEAAQRNIERTGATLVNFTKGDAGSAMVRRDLDKLAAQE